MKHSMIAGAAGAALLIGGFLAGAAFGSGQSQRTILNRIDIAGTDKEAIIGIGDAAAGGSLGAHSHPGEELGYVLSGEMVLKVKGKPDLLLHTGEAYTLPRGTVHNFVGKDGQARMVVVWIVGKAQPLSTPAP